MEAFEDKYKHEKQSRRFEAPDGFVDKLASDVSNRIGSKNEMPFWLKPTLAAAGIMALFLIWFSLPDNEPNKAQQLVNGSTEQIGRSGQYFAGQVSVDSNSKQIVMTNETNEVPAVSIHEIDNETIVEYLMDEDYEEN